MAPCTRYVLSDSMFRTISTSLEQQGHANSVRSWSCFNSYERRYGGQDLNGRRLAIYRENGMGDNLMVTGLTGYLKHTFPNATIDVYALPRVGAVWAGNADVNFFDVPPPFDAVKNGYDYHLFFEGMIENDNEQEQGNAYDNFLAFSGVFPKSVPDNFKRPQIFWTEMDDQIESDWLPIMPREPYVVWHWNPSGRVRMYPYDLSRQTISMLAEHFAVVVIGDTNGEVEPLNLTNPRVFDWLNRTPSVRSFLPILKHAKATVCPDSCVLHLASAFPNVPCIGLWGPFSPNDRATYYKNHVALSAFNACPSAPCRSQKSVLPVHRCAQATGYAEGEQFCRAMWAIEPQHIVEEVCKRV